MMKSIQRFSHNSLSNLCSGLQLSSRCGSFFLELNYSQFRHIKSEWDKICLANTLVLKVIPKLFKDFSCNNNKDLEEQRIGCYSLSNNSYLEGLALGLK